MRTHGVCGNFVATGETVNAINKGAAGQTRTLERAGSRPTNQVSTSEQKTVLPAGGGPPRPSPYGACPSCGYPRDLAAFEHCNLCRQALRDEEEEPEDHNLPTVRMARAIGACDDYRRHE